MEALNYILQKFSQRFCVRDALVLIQQTLWMPILAAIIIRCAGRFTPIINLDLWTISPFVLWLVYNIGQYFLRRPSSMRVAQRIDLELSLKERLSTALALNKIGSKFPQHLVKMQLHDALSIAQNIDPIQAIPVKTLKRPLLLSGLFIIGLLIIIALPNPMEDLLAQQALAVQIAEEQAEKIDKLRQEIESSESLQDQDREELLQQLAELIESLEQNSGDLEQALADLSTIERSIQSKLDPNAREKASNLETVFSQLSTLFNQDNKDSGLDTAIQSLENLSDEVEKMGADQRQELAQALAQMAANSSQGGNSDLAQALSSLSQSIQTADQETIEQSTQDVQEKLEEAQSQLNNQTVFQQALSQLLSSSQAFAQAGQETSQASNQGPSQNQAPGGSQNQNQGQGQVSGGGSNADTLPPNTSQGQAGSPDGPLDAVTDQGDISSQVYVPRQDSQSSGEQLFIPGQDSGQGDSQVSSGDSPLPGSTNQSLVPYIQVFPSYFDAANQTMQQFYIPPALEAYIRQYFTQLEP